MEELNSFCGFTTMLDDDGTTLGKVSCIHQGIVDQLAGQTRPSRSLSNIFVLSALSNWKQERTGRFSK